MQYRYACGGQTYTSEQYQRTRQSFSDYGKVARLTERYRAETAATCYVNPSAPAEAVLQRGSFFMLPFVLLPMIFILVGAGGIYATWRAGTAGEVSGQSISQRASSTKGQRVGYVFFCIFLLAGSGFFYGFGLRPALRVLGARNWPAVPCVVLSSQVKTHADSDGDTYRVDILYRYEFKGREFKSNRYHFLGGSSSGYQGKQAIVNHHPPGSSTVCYVNPEEPTEAVLERGFTRDMWFGLIPLLFICFGAGGLVVTYRKNRQTLAEGAAFVRSSSGSGGSRHGTVAGAVPTGSADGLRLKPRASPWGKLLAITAIALFWNGIVSVFVGHAVEGWRSGRGEWGLTLFMVPFVAVGLALIGGVFYCLLAMFNPRPRLEVTPGAVPLGGTLRVDWELRGRADVLRRLRIRLQGHEEAKYRRGTNTCTDTNLFADFDLADITVSQEMRSGSRTVSIPANLMHTFTAKNNRIVWSVRVHGDIPRWPDVKEEFPIVVLPAKAATPNQP